uniref:DUF5648 domain-containing protein n=1 Tax=Plectus sambesii TaxID=2011161 RepID=A0A914VSV2_9BILA
MEKREERCRSPGRGGHHHRGGHHSPGRGGHRGGHGHSPDHHHGHHHGHHSPGHHGDGSGSGSHSPSPEPQSGSHGQTGHGPVVSGQPCSGPPCFPPTVDIYRSFNGQFCDHFYTVDLTEHFKAVQHLGYANEGIVGRVLADPNSIPPCPRLKPLYRLWNGDIRDHFYTTDEEERQNAISRLGYTDEGILGYCVIPAHATNPTPESDENCCGTKKALHRFYNEKGKDHFYTASEEEKEHVISALHDYKYEGVQCYLW